MSAVKRTSKQRLGILAAVRVSNIIFKGMTKISFHSKQRSLQPISRFVLGVIFLCQKIRKALFSLCFFLEKGILATTTPVAHPAQPSTVSFPLTPPRVRARERDQEASAAVIGCLERLDTIGEPAHDGDFQNF